jgi:outer membrane protein TolC
MRKYKSYANKILTLIFLTVFNINAQQKIYTLDEAITTAIQNNKDIKISAMNVKKAGAAVNEAFGYALPSLDLSANFAHYLKKPKMPFPDFGALLNNATYSILFDENIIPRDDDKFVPVETTLQSFVPTNNYTTEVTLTQTLFSSAVFEGIGASKIYYQLAEAELNNTISKTVLEVQKAFYGVLLAKAVLDIAKSSFENAQENFSNVNASYKEGLVSEFDNLQAEVQVENIRPYVLQMENVLLNAKDGLKILLGEDQKTDIDVTGEFIFKKYASVDEQILINEALQNNPDLKSLELKMQVDKAFIQLDVSEYWPNIFAFGNYAYAGAAEEWDFQNYSSFTVGLGFRMNLWQGNRTKNSVQQSTITYQQTQEQLFLLKDAITVQIKSLINELKRTQELIEVQNRTIQLAERAYEIATVRYKEGAGSQLEVQNADRDLRQARLNRTQTIHSYLITINELERILGRTNPAYFEMKN